MIRGGGDPNTAMALKPCPEWARRLGASPQKRIVASWSGSRNGPNRIQGCGASIAPERGLPSDQLYRTSNNEGHRVAVTLDTKVLIQGCVKTHLSQGRSDCFLNCPLPAAPISAIGFRGDEIEIEFLRASSASEFSHSLGQKAKCSPGVDVFRFGPKSGHR